METDELVLLFTQKSPSGGRAKTTRTFRSGGGRGRFIHTAFPPRPDGGPAAVGLGRDTARLVQDSAGTRPGFVWTWPGLERIRPILSQDSAGT